MTELSEDAPLSHSSQVRLLSSKAFEEVLRRLDRRDRKIGAELEQLVRNHGGRAKIDLYPLNDFTRLRTSLTFRLLMGVLILMRSAYRFARKCGLHIRNPYRALRSANRFARKCVRQIGKPNRTLKSSAASPLQETPTEDRALLVSVITPVYKPNMRHLKDCLRSVGQDGEVEHILAVDGVENAGNVRRLKNLAEKYGAVLLQQSQHGGISRATNHAAVKATGEYLLFLDQDDYLDPMWFPEFKRSYADADIVHSDSLVVAENRRVVAVSRKPEWSPIRLWGNMYCAHFFAVKRKIFNELGGLRPQFDGAQDHDLALRVSLLNPIVAHIPIPLYSWRQSKTSTAMDAANKPYAQIAGLASSQAHLDSMGMDAKVVATEYPGHYRIRFPPRSEPVSVVIPTAFAADQSGKVLLDLAVESLASDLRAEDEIIVVCGDEVAAEMLGRLADSIRAKVTLLQDSEPFHFSRRANLGYAAASNDFILLLNDDVYFTSTNVLDQLLGYSRQSSIGLVGALLWFPDGKVQHGGHLVQHGEVGHAGFGLPSVDRGDLGSLIVDREVVGVTGAAVMQRKSIWDEVGGFSNLFPNNFNDVDYSFKVARQGHSIIQANSVEGIHDESSTRDSTVTLSEITLLRRRWNWKMDADPYSFPK